MAGPNIPTRVMMFRDFVPDRIRVFLCLLFALIFQFSGGIYLSSVSQMVGSTALMQEDIMMAGYASFVGMTVVFPILFRLKFRFTTRSILLFICPSLILCNIITMYTESLPVLVIFCFIAGVLRMWGTFEALSNVQLSITPTRDFAVFFPVVYMIVLGSIQLSGLATVYLGYWANWKYMHLFIIGLLLIMWALVAMLTHHFRFMKPMPLFGIDWLGGALWSIFLLSLIFVFEYGKFYDWYDSWQIVMATVITVVSLAMSIHRMIVMRHPYISLEAFKYKNLTSLLFLFLMLCLFLTTSSVLQEMFMNSILQYDSLNAVSLNWYVFIGILAGAGIVFYRQVVLRKGYKPLISVGFILIVVYQYYMYFLIYPTLNIESLYLPNFLKGVGHGILYISLTIYVAKTVPFKHFFQGLCVLSFIRTSITTPLGTAILTRCLKHMQLENIARQSWKIDEVGEWVPNVPIQQLYAELIQSSLTTSLKELFGVVCIVGTIFLIVILNYKPLMKLWFSFKRYRAHIAIKNQTESFPEQLKQK